MTLSKILLIDTFLILLLIPLILIINGSKNKEIDEKYKNLPNFKELIESEKLAQKEGSGIGFDSMIGVWNFISVWKKDSNIKDNLASSLLRFFSAKLEIKESHKSDESQKYEISNSIEFGLLTMRFLGSGKLKGRQPLLLFFFERIELTLASNILLSREFTKPIEKKRPFFALIEINEERGWLSARGRGGGLALWLKS